MSEVPDYHLSKVLPEPPVGLSDFIAHVLADDSPLVCLIDRKSVIQWWEYTKEQQRILAGLPSLLAEMRRLRSQVVRTAFSICGNERNEW